MNSTSSNIPVYCAFALGIAALAAIVALAFKGSITGTDAKDGIFAILALFGVGTGAAAVHAGVQAGAAGATAQLQASLEAGAQVAAAQARAHADIVNTALNKP